MTVAHRTAIALNNLAVRFAERGYDKKAFETLRDSVGLLKVACEEPDVQRRVCAVSDPFSIQIRRAAQRLATCHSYSAAQTTDMTFSAISDETDMQAAQERLVILQFNEQAAWNCDMIRIEHDSLSAISSPRDFDVDTAIILHNYGLSCLCQSVKTTDSSHSSKLQETAVKLVRWSQSVLFSCVHEPVDLSVSCGNKLNERAYWVTLIATKSLAHTLLLTAGNSCAKNTGHDLQHCLAHLENMQRAALSLGLGVFLDCRISQKVAAAAA